MKSHVEYATQKGQDALTNARATLERALSELDDYISRFAEAASSQDKSQVLNWALNHLATYIPSNVRLDMIASAQAELAKAAH